jgi:hypothetical protein
VKRALAVAAVLAAVVSLLAAVSLPPASLTLVARDDGAVSGAMHVHSNRSDGRASPDEVALAAARAGLTFLILTDHGDATRSPDPPIYRSGVLCLDGVEVSTAGGHYLAFDMPAAPYPLGGEARDVVEDVRRLGGFGVIAHPDSPKPELRWRDWTLPVDGVELLNLDTSWRRYLGEPGWRPKQRLLRALFAYPFRPDETIGNLLSLSSQSSDMFAGLSERRRIVVLAGSDAHAQLALTAADPGQSRFTLPFPGYETVFRALALRVRPERALTGNAATDARLVLEAIRAGHVHTTVRSIASPANFDFTAENRNGVAREGDRLTPGGPVTLRVRSNAPETFRTTIWEGSRVLAGGTGPELDFVPPGESGTYRVEIHATDRSGDPVWIISNPVYIRNEMGAAGSLPQPADIATATPLFNGRDTSGWRTEAAPPSVAELSTVPAETGPVLHFSYTLQTSPAPGQFAAFVAETPGGVADRDSVTFRTRADRPMRLSVQVRVAVTPAADEWWTRSVYLGTMDRDVTVLFDDMTAAGVTRTPTPPRAQVHSIVFVVDTTNTKPGSSGQVWITRAGLGRSSR